MLGRDWLYAVALAAASLGVDAQEYRERLPQDEVIYFLLPDRFANGDPANDRGGLRGGRLQTGFDPAAKGFFHGGDLRGVLEQLDYIQQLGATAVWLAPIFRNKPVQGAPGQESAGYHGYWITDFTRVDPHFGTEEDFQALVDAAHGRGMKIYMDIVVNHTADVIFYRQCTPQACPYRSRVERPYTPYVPKGQEHIKVPDWLNDLSYYHNRGNSTFEGESALDGDFAGLDDLMTENPRVVQGFIDIYGAWIDRYSVDGFRIDTARHVNSEFLQAFVPAMLARARARGIPNFHIFGEVYTGAMDVALLARHTRLHEMPAVLDFAFAAAVRESVAGARGTDVLERLFADDVLYEGGADTALQLPTFISNHDQGRFAAHVRAARPGVSDEEVSRRTMLAHAMLLTLRGVPVLYYGDEQGFVGTTWDQDARQDLFGHFDRDHSNYRGFAQLAHLRVAEPALRRGRQITRAASMAPGLFAVSRIDPVAGREVLVAFNTSGNPVSARVHVNVSSRYFSSLHGQCQPEVTAPGIYAVTLPPLDYILCGAHE
jgi:glycosidase